MSERIIKSGSGADFASYPGVAARVVKGESYDARREAACILDAARAEARSIVADAEQHRDRIFAAARQEGYERGLRDWNEAISDAHSARDRRLAESEPELVRLAVRIAEKILGQELLTNRQAIVSVALASLRGIGRERMLTIHVNPCELASIKDRIDILREAAGPHRSVEVVPDASVEAGGCVIESEYGVIDARLETQLRCMEDILVRAART